VRFLLVDSDSQYRKVLRYHLLTAWPDAHIDEHGADVGLGGNLSRDGMENLVQYDAVLLGFPRSREDGLAWLALLTGAANFPPVIVFADPSDEFLAVDSLKSGAESYFPKLKVTHVRLVEAINTALTRLGQITPDMAAHRFLSHGSNAYQMIRELHASQLASVYVARPASGRSDLQDRDVVLKVIRYVPDVGGEKLFDRFLQEYEIIAGVEHQNIVEIFDIGVADDHAFIAMEYLSEGTLAQRINKPLDPEFALSYTRQIASALRAVHGAGIQHRDLKPANIMFRSDATLALIDFGLAKQSALQLALTGNGQIFGTPYYMSPEQGHAEPTDARSDLYSLGCVFYEMLTGRRPFLAATAMGVIYKHAHAERPQFEGGLAHLQPVLTGLLAASPDERFASADALLEVLDRYATS
jgi:serine/threonine protein kinase